MAVAIVGLICVGVLGLGAVLALRQANQTQTEVVQATPVIVPQPTLTPTPTITPIPPTATNTPEPTPTSTLVVGPTAQEAAVSGEEPVLGEPAAPLADTATPDPNATATSTLVLRPTEVGTPTPAAVAVNPPAQIPQGGGVLPGDKGFLAWAGLGLLVLLILGLVNFLRSPSSLSDR
ncbi:MAG: hypothetical protein BroJett011_43540 [Chloroflexota bacterium]|nr:MAG: hypothetical protein BroJett011_43540 [Chloroflexota bacterium]